MCIEKKLRFNLFELKSNPVRCQLLSSIPADQLPREKVELPNGEVHFKMEYNGELYVVVEERHIGQSVIGDIYDITIRKLSVVKSEAEEIRQNIESYKEIW